ncbi:competence protein ComK [Bacillus fonticola]|uniref:competence protein ComK n=1 Tax=Bacillus fonticola TaxID=2728853 RepID=UPI00147672CC|nr:competence protein ComK [Bacillus fonticola]
MNTKEVFELSPQTLALLPYQYGSKSFTRALVVGDELQVACRPIEVVKRGCAYFGSSYEGRKAGTRQLTGITHKAPIAVDPTNEIFLFPTLSPTREECAWIAHDHVAHFSSPIAGETEILFRDGQSVILPISDAVIENQMLRTSFLRTKLAQRISEPSRGYYMMIDPKQRKMNEHSGRQFR